MLQLGAYANLAGLRPCATLEACATRLPPESDPSFFLFSVNAPLQIFTNLRPIRLTSSCYCMHNYA